MRLVFLASYVELQPNPRCFARPVRLIGNEFVYSAVGRFGAPTFVTGQREVV
jgi:hypothetical protein